MDIITIISLIHVIRQVQPSTLPWLGPVLPSVDMSGQFGTGAKVSYGGFVVGSDVKSDVCFFSAKVGGQLNLTCWALVN